MRAALALLPIAIAGCGAGADPVHDARHDGLWRATAIDGGPVGRAQFLIRLRGGRVVGGKDGCNSWAFDQTQRPAPDGTRSIASDLMACSGLPQRPAYWRALGNGNVLPLVTNDGQLRLHAGGSEILARRAERPLRPGRSDRP